MKDVWGATFDGIDADATLHVDAALVDTYKRSEMWTGWFGNIVALNGDADGIRPIDADMVGADAPRICRIYTVDGKELPAMQRGLNILRKPDGTVVKVMR